MRSYAKEVRAIEQQKPSNERVAQCRELLRVLYGKMPVYEHDQKTRALIARLEAVYREEIERIVGDR